MTREEILKMRDRSLKKATRYYDDFQNGASSQYYSHYRRESDIVWLCETALKGSEDREAAVAYKNFFSGLYEQADRALYKNDLESFREVVQAVLQYGKYELNMHRRFD